MMKGFLLVSAIVASTLLCFSASAEQITDGEWTLEQTVDDFGDVTDDSEVIIKTTVGGSFSNTATADSELEVVVCYCPEQESFLFRLLEYENTPATYYDNSELRLLFKVDDTVYEHYLYGNAPNEDLLLYDYGELVSEYNLMKSIVEQSGDNLSTEKKQDMLVRMMELDIDNPRDLPLEESGSKQLLQFINNGDDVRCVIYIDNSKYNFTIDASGFSGLYDQYHEMEKRKTYDEAISYLEEKDYETAKKLFITIKDYLDSEVHIDECDYHVALSYLEEGEYEKAKSLFQTIEDYSDTKKRITECDEGQYNKALSLLENGEFETAKRIFQTIEDYSDAKKRIEECDASSYRSAVELVESGNIQKARDLFDSLGDYKNTVQYIGIIDKYEKATNLFREGQYESAKTLFEELGDFYDAEEMINECDTKIDEQREKAKEEEENKKSEMYSDALELLHQEKIEEAVTILDTLGDYEDSVDIIKECEEYEKTIQESDSENYEAITSFIENSKYIVSDETKADMAIIKPFLGEWELIDGSGYMFSYLQKKATGDKLSIVRGGMRDNLGFYSIKNGIYAWILANGENGYTSFDASDYDAKTMSFTKDSKPGRYVYSFTDQGHLLVSFMEKISGTDVTNRVYADSPTSIAEYVKVEEEALDSIADSTIYNDAEIIKKAQESLNNAGYDCGTPDGSKGPKTTSAIQAYQTDNGLEATGEIDGTLLNSLGIQ